MDRQDEALKLLKDIKSINRMIEELQMQIDEIYSMLTSTTVKPKEVNVQFSGDADPLATKMCKILECQEELQKHQTELCERKSKAIKIIQQMDIDNQSIIVMRYFRGLTIEEIAEELHRSSYYHTWEVVHKAEEEFCDIYSKWV